MKIPFIRNAQKTHRFLTMHHLASTGGTILAKLLATSDDIYLLNEVHPFATMIKPGAFSPTTPTEQLVGRYKTGDTQLLSKKFEQELLALLRQAGQDGKHLIVRDWSHGDFMIKKPCLKDSLNEVIRGQRKFGGAQTKLVTLRDPIDSFLSSRKSGFLKLIGDDFETYCVRSLAFWEIYKNADLIMKYEDIVQDPRHMLSEVEKLFGINYPSQLEEKLNRFYLSGNSGRSDTKIGLRPRVALEDDFIEEVSRSKSYPDLIDALGYASVL